MELSNDTACGLPNFVNVTYTYTSLVRLTLYVCTMTAAVELSNDTVFGLTAAVFTKDLSKARRVASKIRAGQVRICISGSRHDLWRGQKALCLQERTGREIRAGQVRICTC